MEPRTSVIVPTFNRAALLPQALDSLLAQTRPVDELLVVDDGSSDDTAAVLERYRGRIRTLRQDNAGKAAALNLGLTEATGDLLWFFDDDDIALPNALARHLEALASHPDAGFTMSPGLMCNPVGGRLAAWPVQPSAPPFGRDDYLAYILVAMPAPFHLQGALVRRPLVLAAGGFDPVLLRSQDYAFLVQLGLRARPVRMDAPTYLHRSGDHARGTRSTRHAPEERVHHWVRYNRVIWEKLRGQVDLLDHLPRLPDGRRAEASPDNLRSARVSRCAALYYKGIWAELEAELESGFTGNPADSPHGRFAAELWMNTCLGLRRPLWEELDGTEQWQRLAERLRGPAWFLGRLMAVALRQGLSAAQVGGAARAAPQLVRMLADLGAAAPPPPADA